MIGLTPGFQSFERTPCCSGPAPMIIDAQFGLLTLDIGKKYTLTAKIDGLGASTRSEQEIGWFQVTMNNITIVAYADCFREPMDQP